MLKVYAYKGCSSCRNAIKWLREQGIDFEEKAIRETPPANNELEAMLSAKDGRLSALFNTSGQDYRALGLKDKLPAMQEKEALQLLAENGNLVKRPFVVDPEKKVYLLGFKPAEWEETFS